MRSLAVPSIAPCEILSHAHKGHCFDLQRFSIHDGPGIRTVIFFKGCPLRCRWCQNPEGLDPEPEISFSKEKCLGCRECRETCPVGAIMFEGMKRIDRRLCDHCGRCVEVCYAEALQIIGKSYTPTKLLEEALDDMPFFESSGGGITLSGGEPTYQAEFLASFLPLCRDRGVHITLETCGYVARAKLQALLPLVDLVLFDIKAINSALHRDLTGKGNEIILDNLKMILKEDALKLRVRVPLIPSLTTTDENVRDIIRFLEESKIVEVALLPYHRMGESKLEKVDSRLKPLGLTGMSAEDLANISTLFQNAGIDVVTQQ